MMMALMKSAPLKGKLPHELSFDQNNVEVVEMLGEPHNKGGNNVPVWIEVSPLLTILRSCWPRTAMPAPRQRGRDEREVHENMEASISPVSRSFKSVTETWCAVF